MLELINISKKYGKKVALRDFNLSLDQSVYGLLGPNGSGKTTLLRILIGLLEPNGGHLIFDGKSKRTMYGNNLTIGYLPQKFGLLKELTVWQHMTYFAALKKIPANLQKKMIEEAVSAVNLEDMMNARCGSLSGGMVRRLGVAQAILGKPDLLLFDEPTTGLDPEERLRFKTVINNYAGQCPIILSTHIVEDVESVCDRVVVLHEGTIRMDDKLTNLVQLATDRVYEMPLDRLSQLGAPHFVSRYSGNATDGKLARILLTGTDGSNWRSPAGWEGVSPCAPTVEDGYLYLIKREGD